MSRILLPILFALLAGAARADVEGLDAAQEARYHGLINELRCLVCQNQTIAESNAPLAVDLRQQVAKQIAEGRDDTAIRGYLTERYGDFVLYRPPFKASTVLLWLGPFLLLAGGLGWALAYVRRQRAPVAAMAPADPEAVQRLLAETQARLAAQDAEPKPTPRA